MWEHRTEKYNGLPDDKRVQDGKKTLGLLGWQECGMTCIQHPGKYVTYVDFKKAIDPIANAED